MSREDLCARPKCGRRRFWDGHDDVIDEPNDHHHDFVEPARGEAPQGETWTAEEIARGQAEGERLYAVFHEPTAQPETGDEARVREIAARLTNNRFIRSATTGDFALMCVRVGLAAGRAAENEACEKLRQLAIRLRDSCECRCEYDGDTCDCGGDGTWGLEGCWYCDASDVLAIAARRGRTGT